MRAPMLRNLAIAACLAIVPLASCEVRERAPAEPAQGSAVTEPTPSTALTAAQRSELRTAAVAKVRPFQGRPEYAVADPELVDPCVDGAVAKLGHAPAAGELDGVLESARICLERKLSETDGLARLSAKIQARYLAPVITRSGDVVHVDVGVVSGSILAMRAKAEIARSPFLERGEWMATEVVKHLQLGIAQHPDAASYQAEVEIPRKWGAPEWTYVYDRADDRIRVYSPEVSGEAYVTGKLGGNLAAAGSLHTSGLTREKSAAPTRAFVAK